MRRTSLRARALTAITVLAVAGGGLLALAPPASAAAIATTLHPASAPTVYVTGTAEVGADWTTPTLGAAVHVNDTISISIDDNDATANCSSAADSIGFASPPTITNTTSGDTAAFGAGVLSSSAACGALSTPVKDIVTFTATAADAGATAALRISGVRYSVGSGVAIGPIQVGLNGAAPSTAAANATISAVRVTPGTPVLMAASATAVPVGNVTLTELRPGAVSGATSCIKPLSGSVFTAGSTPVLTATGGNGVAGTASVSSGNVVLPVTTPSTTSTTYTLSGLKMDAQGANHPIVASVGSTCSNSIYAPSDIQLGHVGAVNRLSGSTRYATAQIIADTIGSCQNDVIVASGVNFPDALAASYLANTTMPILLVADTVPTETANAIRLHGVKNIVIVGGPSSVSTAIETGFQNQTATSCGGAATANKITTQRIAGADRYATAKAVAEKPGLTAAGTAPTALSPTCTNVKTAIVTSGENFPDALAAGVLSAGGAACGGAGHKPLPLVLTNASSLNLYASQTLNDMGIKQVLLVGGTSAVTDGVLTQIQNLGGTNSIAVRRISGPDRQGTAASLATLMGSPELGYNGGQLLLTRGDIFPDALVGAPYGAKQLAPLLLSATTGALGSTAGNAITGYPNPVGVVTLLGGTSSLTQAVADAAATALAGNPY